MNEDRFFPTLSLIDYFNYNKTMSLYLKIFMFITFYCIKAQAIITPELLKIRILKAYDKNILIINRGKEDHINVQDHIKITNPQGFIARGICIKSGLKISHWKIYRVVNPSLVTMDEEFILTSLNQSAIPYDLADYLTVDFSPYYNDFNDKDYMRPLARQQKRLTEYDLPLTITEKRSRKKENSLESVFNDDNFNLELLKNDFKQMKFDLFFSELNFETLNQNNDHFIGFEYYNMGRKYDFKLYASQLSRKLTERSTNLTYNREFNQASINFRVKRVSDTTSLETHTYAYQDIQGDIGIPRVQMLISPIGLIKHFETDDDNKKGQRTELVFRTLFDQRQYNPDQNSTKTNSGSRLGFEFHLQRTYSALHSMNFDLYYRPRIELATQQLNFNDTLTHIAFRYEYLLNSFMALGLDLQYYKDQQIRQEFNLPDENIIQSLKFILKI